MQSPVKILLALLGSILGMSAAGCGGQEIRPPTYGPMPLYGAPYAEYKLSGKVVDASTSAGIPGIALSFQGNTITSGPGGTWTMDAIVSPCESSCALTAKDTDGTSNGSYTDLEVPLAPTQTSGGSGNNNGVFEQKDIQVSLVAKP